MDVTLLNYLYVLMVMLVNEVTRVAGDCNVGSKVTYRQYSDTIVNHTIVGPIMSSITAKNERECEMECHLAVPDMCYMFNYYPSSKVCELLYKDRAAEYKVEKKKGSTCKTRKCESSSCKVTQHCVSLGDQSNTLCLNFTGCIIKANTAPVCIGAKDDSYGTFFAPVDGKVKTFKLVHISGGIAAYGSSYGGAPGNWGTLAPADPHPHLELHVTDTQNSRITPPSGYPLDMKSSLMRYGVPGFTVMSPDLVFPDISLPLAVSKGKEFRIWEGQDLINSNQDNNFGQTCADVYVFFLD
ncbi:uncharacterized protein LOC116302390 [Actinia tenebrosa]|uniref:Uncharacterized protein LOC116302390 n=1 Tax=Actinia tenebrosa TaxID=6105 RepID=A0A6P8IL79_ACTTE|nr:uncharacterized protein LOC116302390 [Actinia tenebrosa]